MTRKVTGGASPTRESGEALFRAAHCLDRAHFNWVEGCVSAAHWERKLFLSLHTVISWATDHMPCVSHVPGSQQASVEGYSKNSICKGSFHFVNWALHPVPGSFKCTVTISPSPQPNCDGKHCLASCTGFLTPLLIKGDNSTTLIRLLVRITIWKTEWSHKK